MIISSSPLFFRELGHFEPTLTARPVTCGNVPPGPEFPATLTLGDQASLPPDDPDRTYSAATGPTSIGVPPANAHARDGNQALRCAPESVAESGSGSAVSRRTAASDRV